MKKLLIALLLAAAPAYATLTDTSNGRRTAVGDGATLAYVFTFPAVNTADVNAVVTLSGVTQVISYAVALNSDQIASPGGTVTFASAPPNTAAITIQRIELLTQKTTFPIANPFPAKTVEKSLDSIMRKVQQVDRNRADLAAKEVADISNTIAGGTGAANLIAPIATGTTTARTLATRFAEVLNVKDNGAVGDGIASDVGAIQTTLTAAAVTGKTVFFPAGTYNLGAVPLTLPTPGVTGITLLGDAQGSTIIKYSGTGQALTIGSSAIESDSVLIKNFTFVIGSVASSGAISLVRVTRGFIENVNVNATTNVPELGTGILLDGTGGYSGSTLFKNVWVLGNFHKGIYCQGAAVTNSCNHHSFDTVLLARWDTRPGTGSIGIHFGPNSGDNLLHGPDVEGYDVAYQFDGNSVVGTARCEQNGVCVAFGATSYFNRVALQAFSNTTNVTYAGGQVYNSAYLPDGIVSNVNNGSVGSSIDINDRTDHAITIGFQAGATVEQNTFLQWRDRTGVPKWTLWRNGVFNIFELDDSIGPVFKVFSGALGTGGIQFVKGISNDGSGFKHKRGTAGCATAAAAGATCATVITWTTAVGDANYTVAGCMGNGVTSGVPVIQAITAKVSASITVQTAALTGVAAQFTAIECTIVHD